ncbi:StfH/YfcO family fimbrial adhesin [Pseudocitrobacter corydidari]
MKIIRWICCLLMIALMSFCAQAQKKVGVLNTLAATTGNFTTLHYYLNIITPDGVYYGEYKSHQLMLKTGVLDLVTWSGPNPAPEMRLEGVGGEVNVSNCPGLAQYDAIAVDSDWQCRSLTIGVYSDLSYKGCPWLISTYVESEEPAVDPEAGIFKGPLAHNSTCPAEPLEPYDISWNEDSVVHNEELRLQSSGAVIEQTLATYLMKNGKLCDGSKMDERGSYCRFVSQMITFTASGCDNAKVTVTPNRRPITDKQLHDMVVRVDTTALQPIDSTCRFQYVLNMI